MDLNDYQKFAYRRLGAAAQRRIHRYPTLGPWLQRAHIGIRPEVHLATTWLTAILTAAFGALLVFALTVAWAMGLVAVPMRFLVLLPIVPFMLGSGSFLAGIVQPQFTARARAKDIDAKLPYALNYLSTMANAGATPEAMFRSLAQQDIYGEVANEAAWLDRDVSLLGLDMVTALNKAMDRTPSIRFQDLVQGIITVLTSGGDVKQYLLSKGEQYLIEARQENQRFMDSMGVLAESFVVVVVAAPLFMLVILSVMTMFGSDPRQVLRLGYLMVLLVLPLAQFAFGYMIKSTTPEA